MNDEIKNTSKWQKAKESVKGFAEEAPTVILGAVSFSLLFMLGLVTLGISLMAGVVAVLMVKWHQRKMRNEAASQNENHTEEEPIAAV